eukprot:m.63683 g.63683  ORF g.63683 m.63683 type:complete len:60 (-) comp13459_c1_seq1:501-680(-)
MICSLQNHILTLLLSLLFIPPSLYSTISHLPSPIFHLPSPISLPIPPTSPTSPSSILHL